MKKYNQRINLKTLKYKLEKNLNTSNNKQMK